MKHCPNPDCAHLAQNDRVAEFLDTVELCTDCGAALRHGEAPPQPSPTRPTYRELETVYETSDSIQAHLIRSLLEQDDIAVHVAGEPLQGAVGELPHTTHVHVQVEPGDVERARRIISARDGRRAEGRVGDRASRGFSWATLLVGMVLGGLAATAYWRRPVPPEPIVEEPRPGQWDRDRDGRPDAWARYGKGGIMVESSYDENSDGAPDGWHELGEAEQTIRGRWDTDFDGREDYWEEHENGQPSSYSADNDRDGVRDEWGEYEVGGRQPKLRLWSFKNDAIIDKRAVYKNGRRIQEQYDRDRDGKFDETLDLDEFERVIRRD